MVKYKEAIAKLTDRIKHCGELLLEKGTKFSGECVQLIFPEVSVFTSMADPDRTGPC